MELATPAQRPKEFANRVLAVWEERGKGKLQLADLLGVTERSLNRWLSGDRASTEKNAARALFQLHAARCYEDAAEFVDLAWLMGMTPEAVYKLVSSIYAVHTDPRIVHFLQWIEEAVEAEQQDRANQTLLPGLPAYYVTTDLERRIKEALVAPRDFRRPMHQVVVLHGGPGVGKTTTAVSLLRDQELQRFFRDGMLFIPLGGEADPGQALWRACEQAGLHAPEPRNSGDLAGAFEKWAGEEQRLALLILDDPQRPEDLAPLLRTGPQVRVVITCQDRRLAARAVEERWGPGSELVLWQPVDGLTEAEGLKLLERWPPQELSTEENQARQRAGERVRWHPLALRLCAAEAGAIGWQRVDEQVAQGKLDPHDFQELTTWVCKSWERLAPDDREALDALRRTLREASSFGAGIAAAVWDQSSEQAEVRLRRLEARGLIERVSQEPAPWQELIERVYPRQERYRLLSVVGLVRVEPAEGPEQGAEAPSPSVKGLQAIVRRAKVLPAGPEQVPWRFRLANVLVLPWVWLLRGEPGELEQQLLRLWARHGVRPPAEMWLTFQKSRWMYVPFGYTIGTILVALGAWYVGTAIRERDAALGLVTLACWAVALLTFQLSVRQRCWWLWQLGLHGEETVELRWTRRVAGWCGLDRQLAKPATT